MDIEKEIQVDNILTQLPPDLGEYIGSFVEDLKAEIESLQKDLDDKDYEIDKLNEEIETLESDLEDIEEQAVDQDFLDLIQEIVDDRYKYIVPTYDSKEKILDRLEFLLKYEV